MAFSKANWKNGGNATNAPNLHTYKTTDAIADVNTAGYFNDVSGEVRVNDCIMCVSSTGGTPAAHFLHINANSSGVVDVTDGLAVGTTDSD
jgi:hypothetical protein